MISTWPVTRASANSDPTHGPFLHGVASGDPLQDRVILWTRVEPDGPGAIPVTWTMATDPELTSIVQTGSAMAIPARNWCLKVDADGLEPYTTYYYAFDALGARSPIGRTKTLPTGQVAHLRLGVTTCGAYNTGFFNTYAVMAEEDLDYVVHLGDYIYEGIGSDVGERVHQPRKRTVTVDEYRMRYAQYRSDPDLQRLHQQHPMIAIWDDHEIANNAFDGGAEGHKPEDGDWTARKQAAAQVHDEWLPRRLTDPGNPGRLYREFRLGDLLDLIMLDTRLDGRDAPAIGSRSTSRTGR